MTIGVGVEGPSDREFWGKVLPKHFPGTRFDMRSMKGVNNLMRQSGQLMESFRDLHHQAGFILLDFDKVFRDTNPCPRAVLDHLPAFSDHIRAEAKKPQSERFLFVRVAVRGLEAWYLSDEGAIRSILPKSTYTAPIETGEMNAGDQLRTLWEQQHPRTALNKIDLAKSMAARFDPSVAANHSRSFRLFWQTLAGIVNA